MVSQLRNSANVRASCMSIELDVEGRIRPRLVNDANGPVNDGQRAQAEKIELDQANRLDIVLIQLGNGVGATFFAVERRVLSEFLRCDDNAAGVLARVAF